MCNSQLVWSIVAVVAVNVLMWFLQTKCLQSSPNSSEANALILFSNVLFSVHLHANVCTQRAFRALADTCFFTKGSAFNGCLGSRLLPQAFICCSDAERRTPHRSLQDAEAAESLKKAQ